MKNDPYTYGKNRKRPIKIEKPPAREPVDLPPELADLPEHEKEFVRAVINER